MIAPEQLREAVSGDRLDLSEADMLAINEVSAERCAFIVGQARAAIDQGADEAEQLAEMALTLYVEALLVGLRVGDTVS